MANRQRPSQNKRARERSRQEKQKQKEARRQEAQARKGTRPAAPGGADPDLEGIQPGPQPKQDWQDWDESV